MEFPWENSQQTEAVAQSFFVKNVFLEILQNSLENISAIRVLECEFCEISNIRRTHVLKEHRRWMLLDKENFFCKYEIKSRKKIKKFYYVLLIRTNVFQINCY